MNKSKWEELIREGDSRKRTVTNALDALDNLSGEMVIFNSMFEDLSYKISPLHREKLKKFNSMEEQFSTELEECMSELMSKTNYAEDKVQNALQAAAYSKIYSKNVGDELWVLLGRMTNNIKLATGGVKSILQKWKSNDIDSTYTVTVSGYIMKANSGISALISNLQHVSNELKKKYEGYQGGRRRRTHRKRTHRKRTHRK
jgi:hypothetical protein